MISKAQDRAISRTAAPAARPKLSSLERGMLKWAVIDPEDKVLDASVGEGLMAEYLRRNMLCEVCGVSGSMEDVRRARNRLQTCDIVYASAGDIPWRENSFDAVFMRADCLSEWETQQKALKETRRVLKEGGQLVMGIRCSSAALRVLSQLLSFEMADESRVVRKRDLIQTLKSLHFDNLSWQRTGLFNGVLIAWKPKPSVEKALEE